MTTRFTIIFALSVTTLLPNLFGQGTNTNIAPATPATRGFDEKSFKVIADRNIFNQSRSRGSARSNNTNAEGTRPRPVQVETFSLVGTMVYDKGPVAFVVGSSSNFQKPIKPGDEIGGFKVEAVAPNLVTLSKDDKKIEMRVGMQMKRTDGSEWKVSEEAPVYSSSSSSSSGSDSASSSGSSAEEDEVLKRLMEKRAKELNR